MGHFVRGDVVLASVSIGDRSGAKTRPAVVVKTGADDCVHVCPISSKPSFDSPSLPITLDDFAEGGLDLFSESYVLTSRVSRLQSGEIIAKKGRLMPETIAEIAAQVPLPARGDSHGRKH